MSEQAMSGYFFEDLKEGMSHVYGKTISANDIELFARVSGDNNPVHLDEEYAKRTMFKGRIAHGILTASLISTAIGTGLPGPGCIYVNQSLRFKAPVRIGDAVKATVTVTKLVPEKKFAELRTVCTVGERTVIDGEATVMVPSRA